MKVLHVIPAVSPRYGGPSQSIVELCRALENEQVQAEICTTDADVESRLPVELGKPVVYRGVRSHFFRRDWSEAFKYSQSMAQWLNLNIANYDVVHIHAVFSHATYAAAQACRRTNRPYIVRPLGTLEPWSMSQKPVRKQLAWRLLFRNVLRNAQIVHYTTEQERKWTEESLDLHGGMVIPNGVDESLLETRGGDRFRKSLAISAEDPFLLTLSRVHPKKGIDLLLKIFVELKARGQLQAWHLVIAGDGDTSYVDKLKRLADGTSASPFVHWAGWLDGPSKRDALVEADLFVLSSYQENFGIGAVESMACGTPVLLSRQVGLAPTILEKNAGWIVDLTEIGLATGLIEASREVAELTTRGNAARELVRERFTWPRIAEEWVGVYERISSKRKESASVHEPAVDHR